MRGMAKLTCGLEVIPLYPYRVKLKRASLSVVEIDGSNPGKETAWAEILGAVIGRRPRFRARVRSKSVVEGQKSIGRKKILACVVVHPNVVLIAFCVRGQCDLREFKIRDPIKATTNEVRRKSSRTEAIDVCAIGGAWRSNVDAPRHYRAGLIA